MVIFDAVLEKFRELSKRLAILNRRPALDAAFVEEHRLKMAILLSEIDSLRRDVAFVISTFGIKPDRARDGSACMETPIPTNAAPLPLIPQVPAFDPEAIMAEVFAGKGSVRNRGKAIAADASILPLIRALHAEGASLRKIAADLNARKIPTSRGGKWGSAQIWRILHRAT